MSGYRDDGDFDDAIVFVMATLVIGVLSPMGETPFFVPVTRLDLVDAVGHSSPLRHLGSG